MSGLLDSVDMRTKLAGENRLELLIFYLSSGQPYGINVFKVKEVYLNPKITTIPGSHRACVGATHFRGTTIPIIDLTEAMGLPPLAESQNRTMITSEYNRSMQGLLVGSVDRIINKDWKDIQLPPPGTGSGAGSYIISITELDNKLVEVIDVEMILDEISPKPDRVSESVIADLPLEEINKNKLEALIVDDSSVARKKIVSALKQLGLEVTVAKTGAEALRILKKLANDGVNVTQRFVIVISDIEMPEMDGYTMVSHIRQDERLKDLYVAVHSSMSGDFNEQLVRKVGADKFIPKFHPDEFAAIVKERIATTQEQFKNENTE